MIVKKKKKVKKRFRIKKKKSIFKSKVFWILLLSILSACGFVYLLIFSQIFQVKEIDISGNSIISNEQLLKVIEPSIRKQIIWETKSIFLIDLNKIEQEILKQFPEIENIELKRRLPELLISEVKERQVFAAIRLPSGKIFNVDKYGIAFEERQRQNDLLVDFSDEKEFVFGENVIDAEKLKAISEIKKSLQKRLDIETEELLFLNDRLNVTTSQGFKIYFGFTSDVEDQIFNLEMLGKEKLKMEELQNLEYIDLRFGDKVFYK